MGFKSQNINNSIGGSPVDEEKLNNQENYRTEYREVIANHRFYVSLRFITAAFTATIQSALLTFYNQLIQQPQKQQGGINIIPLIGIITMFAIFAIERRNISLFRLMLQRGKELEFNLALPDGQFGRLSVLAQPKGLGRIVTHTWGIGFIYGIILTMWIYLFTINLAS